MAIWHIVIGIILLKFLSSLLLSPDLCLRQLFQPHMTISRMIERPTTMSISDPIYTGQYIGSIRRMSIIQEHMGHRLELVLREVPVLIPLILFNFYLLLNQFSLRIDFI